jgi:hypothetical protein
MKIGAEIKATCRNCGENPHTVAKLRTPSNATVTCNKCGAEQRYSAAEGASVGPTISVNTSGKTRSAPKRTKASAVWSPDQASVQPVMSRPIRTYSLAESYRLGDRVEHRTFGVGVVDVILGPQKMQVFFPMGHRIMAQGQPAAS